MSDESTQVEGDAEVVEEPVEGAEGTEAAPETAGESEVAPEGEASESSAE
jgi:hypothetical protein